MRRSSFEVVNGVLWLGEEAAASERRVGGKAAALSRLARAYAVPRGFVLPPGIDPAAASEAYASLGMPPVAVRSSAVDEDGTTHAFAGIYETFLNVVGREALVDAVRRCREAARSRRVLEYRRAAGLEDGELAVLVQELVPADLSAVAFTADPISGDRDVVVVEGSYGLGESIVGGTVTPDEIVVAKDPLGVREYTISSKERMTVLAPGGTREVDVPALLRNRPAFTSDQALDVARLAISLERDLGRPVDVECSFRGGALFLLQARPITTL
jgi:phosphoenolpyruvate synthase/pyruvate phosphate dikinase